MLRYILAILSVGLAGFVSVSGAAEKDWASYNRTLTSERFAALAAINVGDVQGLKILCTYDTGEFTGFQTDLLEVDGALFLATEHDTFSIDPNTCRQNWRAHEDFPSGILRVNRGVAWLAGRLYRGTADGRVLAYEARSGKLLWSTAIADSAKGESVPAAPIAWDGLVFIGMAGGDNKGVKGRMYALNAGDGHIVWEFYMVPKGPGDPVRGPQAPGTPLVAAESWKNTPDFPITGGGTWTSYTLDPTRRLLAEAPKDGHLHVIDLASGRELYSKAVTRVLNVEAPMTTAGMTSPIWPTPKIPGKVVVLGL